MQPSPFKPPPNLHGCKLGVDNDKLLYEIHKSKLKIDEGTSSKNINVLTDIDALSGADMDELGQFESQLRASLLKGNDEGHILLLITSGFTGELAGWWDDHLTDEQKYTIKSATMFDHSQLDQMGNPRVKPNMVNYFIYTICLHFVGNMDVYQARMSEQLINLKCPTLSNFRCRQPTVTELRAEMNSYKKELQELKKQQQDHDQQIQDHNQRIQACESYHSQVLSEADSVRDLAGTLEEVKVNEPSTSQLNEQLNQEEAPPIVNIIEKVIVQKWYSKVTIVVSKAFIFEGEALIDLGAYLNCINESIIPSQYFSKTTQMLNTANGGRMLIEYKLSEAAVCNDGVCLETPFILVKGLSESVILGTPFLSMIYPFTVTAEGIESNIYGRSIKFSFAQQPKYKEIHNL
ncbi:hypothetical protein ACOSQ4_022711 [Xanthoceras sorbifolium]